MGSLVTEATALPRKGFHPWLIDDDGINIDDLSGDKFLGDDLAEFFSDDLDEFLGDEFSYDYLNFTVHEEEEEKKEAPSPSPYDPGINACIVRPMRY